MFHFGVGFGISGVMIALMLNTGAFATGLTTDGFMNATALAFAAGSVTSALTNRD